MKKGSLTQLYGCPIDFIRQREHHSGSRSWMPHSASTTLLSKRMDVASDLYKKDLYAHYGCVNAIEFSSEGNLLISGGDDRRVLLWNLEASLSGTQKPKQMQGEHSSNIFCLGFDSNNSKIFSAGNDEQVIVHDVKTGEIINVFMHEEAVYGVSVNPRVDSVFASAGEDGQVLLFDIRAPVTADPLLLARNYDAFYSVQFHPLEPMFIVTANSKEGVGLWDVRKPKVPVIRYGEKRSPQSSMCAKFNRCGSQIVALRRRLPPVLFNTQNWAPICQFDADHYYNSCTMKSCCFAGSRDQFILSGSDDFNLYMWRIPDNSKVHFVSEAHLVLQGHRSIVNQVRFNPQSSTIASSGVEKIVKLWSPMPLPGSSGHLSSSSIHSNMSRKVYTHEEYIELVLESEGSVSHDYSHGSTDEDPRMMAFFDSLVQREVEGWTTNTDFSDDDDIDDDDDDDIATTSDVDTETTTASQSSLATSLSDNSDSDTNWTDSHPTAVPSSSSGLLNSSSSSSAPLPIRKRRSWSQMSFSKEPSTKRRRGESSSVGPDTSKSTGSEWILRLIAKKRAQLKAAKRERKKRRYLRKNQRFEKLSAIKSFSHTLRNRSIFGERSYDHLVGITRRPSLTRRTRVAPYTTIMVFDENHDSDENEDEHLSSLRSSSIGPSLNPNYSNNRSRKSLIPPSFSSSVPKKRYLTKLSPLYSSCSSDDENILLDKKANTLKPSDNGSVMPKESSYSNFDNVSEIIDSDNSDEDSLSLNPPKEVCHSGRTILSSTCTNVATSLNNGDMCNANLDLSENQIDLDINIINSPSSIGDVIPISSISTDESGSVFFELNNSRVTSELPLDNIDIYFPPSTPQPQDDDISNDSNDKTYTESGNADTPDSGISVTSQNGDESKHTSPSQVKKSKRNSLDLEQQNGLDEDSNSSNSNKLDFSIKKQILKSRLKNYRPRIDDV